MMSPGSSWVNVEMYSISVGTSKHRSSIVARCISWPFSRVSSVCLVMSPASSGVTIQGPKPPVAKKFLPGVN